MRDVLFEVSNLKIPSFGVLVVLGVFCGMLLAQRRAEKFGLKRDQVIDLAMWMLLFGVLGARIAYILLHLNDFREKPHELFQLQFVGMTSFGSLVLGSVPLIRFCIKNRYSVVRLLDLFAPSLLLANAIGRIGCLLNGCCYGVACTLPWAVPVKNQHGLFHPTQIYDSILNLVWLGLFFLVQGRLDRPGRQIGFAFLGYGTSRIISEIWRNGESAKPFLGMPFTEAQLAASVLIAIGAGFYFRGSSASVSDSNPQGVTTA
jgi:phosphatidylglycerol:prolipoprotein diacylglycerol transferase